MRPAVVVTRNADQSAELVGALARAGFETIALPVLAFRTRERCAETDAAIERLNRGYFDWVVLPSANAARCLAELGGRPPARVTVAVQGPKTAEAAKRYLGAERLHVPRGFHAEDLLGSLEAAIRPDSRALVCGAREGRTVLRDGIAALGVDSLHLWVYSTEETAPPPDALAAILERDPASLLFTFLSPSAVRAAVSALGDEAGILSEATLAAIGETTGRELCDRGLSAHIVPVEQTASGLVAAISAAYPG